MSILERPCPSVFSIHSQHEKLAACRSTIQSIMITMYPLMIPTPTKTTMNKFPFKTYPQSHPNPKTGTKRRPRQVDWNDDENKAALMEYLYSASGLYASVWRVECVRDRAAFEELVHSLNLQQPEWSPPSEVVSLNDDEEEAPSSDEASNAEKLKADLYKVDASTLPPAKPQEFEKDDDLNFHIDFLTCSTNLRAWNYDIKASPRHTVKVTAGRIIPALATTTAMVCGLVDIEFCKLVLQLQSKGREVFLNSNINLAAGSGNFTTFCPDPPVPILTNLSSPKQFTSWDKITISVAENSAPKTVEQLVKYINTILFPGVVVDRIFDQKSSNKNASVYSAMDALKLDWEITLEEGAAPTVSPGVFVQWPQLRMAVQMLGRLPSQSNQRKVFEKQVDTIKKALDGSKETFQKSFEGLVQDAHRQAYRPSEDDKDDAAYFDTIYAKRKHLLLAVDCHVVHDSDKKDIHLPPIEFVFA